MIFVDCGAGIVGGSGEAAYEFSGIKRATGNFIDDAECPGILPLNRRGLASTAAGDLPRTIELEIAFHFERLKDFLESGEHIAEPREIACRGFRQNHSAGPAARARADVSRLNHHDG
jgi:hypothetical protein